jgi:hypothetical protein
VSSRRPITRIPALIVAALLAGAMLACNATFGGGTPDAQPTDGAGPAGAPPTVHILEPQSGVRVAANQPLDITVATDTTTTSFLMSVGGRVASTKALPPDQSGPTQAILTWTPDREGTYTVQVVAFNGPAASQPAALIVEVSGVASGPAPGGVAGCVGRVVVQSLNFREGPGRGTARLGQFALGETVTIIGRSADFGWWKVQRANAQQAWVVNNAQWLQVEGQCDAVPVSG